MDFNRDGFNKVVKNSGLTKAELATIYSTTRQTIYNWTNGGQPTNHVILDVCNKVTTGLLKSIEKKLLPYAMNVSKEERARRVNVMRKTLHAQR